METQETANLQKIIETWVHKKIDTVIKTQLLARKISEYGLIDDEKTLPFQILPTTYHDTDGDVICKIYLHMDHPVYGFFVIEINDEQCIVNCPQIYVQDLMVLSHEECEEWIESINSEMDGFYQLSDMANNGQVQFCELFLNKLLSDYKNNILELTKVIKGHIASEPAAAIVVNNIHCLAKDTENDYTRALLLPNAWVVFKYIDDLPDEDEDFESYIDEPKTEELFQKLDKFFKEEGFAAAPIYLAQRICLQAGLSISGESVSDGEIKNALISESGEFVLPPIDTIAFMIS